MLDNEILNNAIDKLLNDEYNMTHSELTPEEVKVIYTNLNCDIYRMLKKRNMFYEDLSKIYKKSQIARNPEEITVDTMVYIGYLDLENKLPTYNLKYSYGDLVIRNSNIYLENLEKVYPYITVYGKLDDSIATNLCNLEDTAVVCSDEKVEFKKLSYGEVNELDNITALDIFSFNGALIQYLPSNFDNYSTLALAAVRQSSDALKYIPVSTENYKEIAKTAIKRGYSYISWIRLDYEYYYELAVDSINYSRGESLALIPIDYEKYKELAILAIEKSNGKALRYVVVDNMDDYLELIRYALKFNKDAIKEISDDLIDYLKKKDIDININKK